MKLSSGSSASVKPPGKGGKNPKLQHSQANQQYHLGGTTSSLWWCKNWGREVKGGSGVSEEGVYLRKANGKVGSRSVKREKSLN